MSRTLKEYAYYGIVVLVDHIKKNEHSDSMTMTYEDFANKINNLDEENSLLRQYTGAPLEYIGNFFSDFDSDSPSITVLVVNKDTGFPNDSFKSFYKGFDKLDDSSKHRVVEEQTQLIKKYMRAGKLDKFLLATVPADYRVTTPTQEDNNSEIVEGITEKEHCEVEYKSRNQSIVTDKKKQSGYICECCGFDFCEAYGELGKEYIECHHIKPLAEFDKKGEKVGLEDLAALCANCHRMIHRLLIRNKVKYKDNYFVSMDDLRDMVKKR